MIKARLKYIIKTQKGKVPKTFSDDSSYPPYLSMDYLRGDTDRTLYVKPKDEYKLVDENEVLVLWDGANAGEVMFSKKGFISSTMAIVTPKSDFFEKRFLFYFLKSIEGELKKASTGTTIPHLDQNFLFNTHFEFLEVEIQKPIADYLDEQSAKITHFIQTKQRFIELLKEQRQSIITNAVTKGIDDGVKMKETGIDWMPEVPEHWEIRRIKTLCNLRSGENITAESIHQTGDYPVYGGNGLRGYSSKFTNEGNYILIGRQGALCGNINYAIGKVWASEHAVIVYPKISYETFWFGEVLRTMNLNQHSMAAAQPGLAIENIRVLKFPYPPTIEEQKQIVEHIKTETRSLDIAISKAEREIDLIKEYREAMIAEAVTGRAKLY